MTLRTFLIGLTVSFGAAWLFAVVVPFYHTRELKPVMFDEIADEKVGVYFPKRTGQIANGAQVYAQNGCYVCHTQVVRPTYAGNDFHRDGWAGFKADPDRGDTRRESNVFDYQQETFAQIGWMRIGEDLSNVGNRYVKLAMEQKTNPETLLYEHLHDPRANVAMRWSTCPSYDFLFESQRNANGQLVPKPAAKALVSYLMSMRKDDAVPAALNYGPKKTPAK